MAAADTPASSIPRHAELWLEISRDFNRLYVPHDLTGSIDGVRRPLVGLGDAIKASVLSVRWAKWQDRLAGEELVTIEALALLADANLKAIDLRLKVAGAGTAAIATWIALWRVDLRGEIVSAVYDLAKTGALGIILVLVTWALLMVVLIATVLFYISRIGASDMKTCIELALQAARFSKINEDL